MLRTGLTRCVLCWCCYTALGTELTPPFCRIVDALAVMSVDLGTEFMKVAIVKPGVPMEIAINK